MGGSVGGMGGVPGFSSGIPGTRPADSLNAGEQRQFCTVFVTSPPGRAITEFACHSTAVLSSGFVATSNAQVQSMCGAYYDACMATPDQSNIAMCEKTFVNCTATVAELEQCLRERGPAFALASAALPSCASATVASATQAVATLQMLGKPPSCAAIAAKCPNLGFE